jgi:hypothetical protein
MVQQFANSAGFSVGTFALCLAAILAVALLTVGSQTLKASLANPAETLRHE